MTRLLMHPITLFLLTWTSVVGLYALHLSNLLVLRFADVAEIALWILLPFVFMVAVASIVGWAVPTRASAAKASRTVDVLRLDRRLRWSFRAWLSLTAVEILVSGGVPILWLLRGSSKTYFDFGIPSLHGFLNSLLLSIGLGQIGLFVHDRRKARLWIPGFIICWSIIVVTRNMMIVFLIEAGVVLVVLQGIQWRVVVKGTALVLLLILLFGYIGDLRSGAESFRTLAQPTANYPLWLPSGVLWVYIYLTTPIGNLVNTAASVRPTYNALFPNTTSLLFPSIFRRIIYADGASEAFSGELITDAFNVSTAYAGAVQDFGKMGIALFSGFCGLCAIGCWRRRTFCGALIYGVIAQCLLLSVFFNHLLYLPVIFQVAWLALFCSRYRFTVFKASAR